MKVIIIGGVAAGMSAASKIIRKNPKAEITVYEKGNFLSYGACGLPYYVGGFNEDYRKMIARSKEQFEQMGIECCLRHEVIAVDPNRQTVTVHNSNNNQQLTKQYDRLMIATGASPVTLSVEGWEKMGVHTLKSLEDGIFLKEYAKQQEIRNVVIVGGGYIGIECAEAFLHLGKNVRVVEAGEHILGPFDAEISALAFAELEKQGVRVHTSEKVTRFEGDFYVRQVITNKASYPADLVIVSVGIRPNTSFLKGSGIKLAENGAILVNQKLETSIPNIYAAGDCSLVYHKNTKDYRYLALGTVANKCGRIAGANIAGGREEFIGALGSAAIKVCDLELARTGLGEKEAASGGIDYKVSLIETTDHPAYYPNPTKLTVKVIYEKKSRKILGAQAIGEKGAVMRINIFAVAIQNEMTTEALGMTDLVYAPPFAGVWDAVQIACNAAK
ncbi:MAG: CoA-disulfide reductase [Eubacteriales bacterium]|nr:CoA-disulfide reductase [Eubacteriales bacterium]